MFLIIVFLIPDVRTFRFGKKNGVLDVMVPKDVAANASFPTLQLGCTEGSAPVAAGIALAEVHGFRNDLVTPDQHSPKIVATSLFEFAHMGSSIHLCPTRCFVVDIS